MQQYHVLGIGNAILDVLSFCEESFLAGKSMTKGTMTLIGEEEAETLYLAMGQAAECSGGSVANSLSGIASLGGRAAFIGKVRDDQLGGIFRHDMRSVGVAFDSIAATTGPATARCLIFVTPDGERTMHTYLGACNQVTEADVEENLVASADITYIEGYLWDQPAAKEAIRKAATLAKKHGKQVALTLSDVFCVDRHRDSFLELIDETVDILFANEAELKALFQTDDFDAAARALQGRCPLAAVTRGAEGSVAITADRMDAIATSPVARVVDTTGAGDLYASGFLYALTHGKDVLACARLGNQCAGEIIQQLGARSQKPLGRLVA